MEKLIVYDPETDKITTLHADDLPDLGKVEKIKRASNVEWEIVPGSGGWDVQLTDEPFNGPFRGTIIVSDILAMSPEAALSLGYKGFKMRAEALQAEVAFLQRNVLGRYG